MAPIPLLEQRAGDEEVAAKWAVLGDGHRASSMELSRSVVYAIAGILTWLTSGGLTYGSDTFGPLYTRLVDEHQWHNLCPNSTDFSVVCPEQEVQLQSVYSTGVLMTVLGQVVFGALLDTIGPRYMTLLAYMFSIAGNICMAVADAANGKEGLLVAGYALIGFGGMGILLASLQLSTLFQKPEIYISYVYVLLMTHVSRASFFWAYTIVIVEAMGLVFYIFPVHNVVSESPVVAIPGFSLKAPRVDKSKLKQLWTGLKTQIKRKDMLSFMALGSMLYLIIVFAGGAIPSIVTSLAHHDAHLKNLYTNYLYPLTAYVTGVLFALLSGSFMLPSLPAQNLSFVLMAAAQGFLNSMQYVYIMHCFPHELYGVLSGLVTLCVFAYGLLSYALTPLTQYAFDGNNNFVFLILLATTILAVFLVRFLREESECHDLQLHLNDIEFDDDLDFEHFQVVAASTPV
ncbi:unnamed protein product [Aphanomyces euteiches]